ncbi:septation ring formation regulator EzrA [Lactiplantibacillus sp. WILCCON 0030]|uniref:Septation ring formation regulator EzrA n=1 Tax=Lactiplantibacillus brownii TaxID=3069269 RepID=A0ABU1AA24_9LACO|nr:septation ring formation regulator EzrA [Lactiplantibacillus brownii]MDQ7937789.1 septation ring formation regulator EzrA [Lactiplantibacillus brownii]
MQVAIGIVVVALVIYAAIKGFQLYIDKQVRQLTTRQQALVEQTQATDFEKIEGLGLTGGSLAKLETLQHDGQALREERLPAISERLTQITAAAHSIKFMDANQNIKKVTASLTVIETKIGSINEGLQALDDADQAHRKAVASLEKKYQDLRKTLLSQNFSFGPSIDRLEDRLANLESDFDKFSQLAKAGDHDAAEQVLDQLRHDTSALEMDIDRIPPIYKDLVSGFPDQLKELETGYRQLIDQHFHFEVAKIEPEIQALTKAIADNTKLLGALKVSDAEAGNHAIEKRIDHLYDVMQVEIDAKAVVDQKQDEISQFLTHATNQNQRLQVELDRLAQSYTLNDHEVERTRELGEQLKNIQDVYQADTTALTTHQAIFSQIANHYAEQDKQLKGIEEEQVTINDGVAGLAAEESKAHDTLQRFDFEIHAIKRQVENLNLPGLPKDYLDYFMVVTKEIERLDHDINKLVINMDDITKQLIVIQSDMATLKEKTNDLIDSAVLSEQLLQYANRYKTNHEDVQAASVEAQRLFNEEHDYAHSLEVIATAIDKIDAGAYKRIEDSYYAQKQTEPE